MESTKDLVSVIIPTYNRAHLIKRSAMSVLNQTYGNLELIIVDDGSTDNTEEVVKSINDNRIIFIKQPNQGACAARNNGIDHAQGEFIAFQDSDDEWHVDKLEKQLKCLKETGADMVYCRVASEGEKISSKIHKSGFLGNKLPLGICPQTFLARRYVFEKDGFDANMPRYQDFELLLRLQTKNRIYCEDEAYVDYYMQNDSISQDGGKLLKAWNIILSKHTDFLSKYSSYLQYLGNEILANALNSNIKYVRNELIKLAFHFKKTPKITIYYYLSQLHVLWIIGIARKIKHFFLSCLKFQ